MSRAKRKRADRWLLTVLAALMGWTGMSVRWAAATEPLEAGLPSELRDLPEHLALVVHAAGAARLAAPSDWQVREIPYRREVRLLIAPPGSNLDRRGLPADGIVLTYHHQSHLQDDPEQLRIVASDRFRALALRSAELGSTPELLLVDQHPAARIGFTSHSDANARNGFFLLVTADWGHYELLAYSAAEGPSHQREFLDIVRSLRLGPPAIPAIKALPETLDAKPILGSWKSYRGKMRLSGDGRVAIATDRPSVIRRENGTTHRVDVITGRLRATGDLLFVEWDDGSRLNFRWRRQGNRLLLTDHTGRTTQLHRIVE